MTTTNSPTVFHDAHPIPTENPLGDVELQTDDDHEAASEVQGDLFAALIARVRKLLSRAGSDGAHA
jgi:hypothetical protein